MSSSVYAVYGASGLGRQVMPLARKQLQKQGISTENLFFVDDHPPSAELNGHKILSWDEFSLLPAENKFVVIAIANNKIRERIANRLIEAGCTHWHIQCESVITMDDVRMGEGALLGSFVLLTSNIRIGKFFHANHYSHVAHDCVIGDFVTFAPGVRCNGNVHIEDYAYIGTGAMLRQGTPEKPLRIGKGAVVGMGAVVTKDVPAGTVVVGNPARPLVK